VALPDSMLPLTTVVAHHASPGTDAMLVAVKVSGARRPGPLSLQQEPLGRTPMHRTFALVVCTLLAGNVLAHGEKPHVAEPNLDPVTTAFGRTGDPKKVARTIVFDMTDDMRFTPNRIEVKRGETLRFRIVNRGTVNHEFVIGNERELRDHAELMKRFPTMEHDEPFMAHVPPGKSGEIVWQFTQPGTFRFACLMPGHSWNDLRDGMVGTIVVR
jgi:uncharacterized cupredoxin-like copper-binding protein